MDQNHRIQTAFSPDLFPKAVYARYDDEHVTSDAGAVLLHAKDHQLGLLKELAACVPDRRASHRSRHSIEDMLRQRVFSIACGYSDGNDATSLRVDPVMKLCARRSPTGDDDLASQPTLSRFENSVRMPEAIAMQARLLELVLDSCRRRYGRGVRRVVIDFDPTDDPTYGGQQLSLFNGYYRNHCYLPLMGFVSFDDHPEQHIIAAILRPGNIHAGDSAVELLGALCAAIKERFPKTRILIRLDGGFVTPELLDFLDDTGRVDYVLSIAKNSVLSGLAKKLMATARKISEVMGESAKVFGETTYAARSWRKRKRRVIIKAEVTRYPGRAPRDNPRFVVTNLKVKPATVYRRYCARGDCENRIKEMKIDLDSGRTSCTSFVANQVRLTMTAAAFVLIQELRADAVGTKAERATVATFRDRLLKIGARVVESTRRVVLDLPASFSWRAIFQQPRRRHLAQGRSRLPNSHRSRSSVETVRIAINTPAPIVPLDRRASAQGPPAVPPWPHHFRFTPCWRDSGTRANVHE